MNPIELEWQHLQRGELSGRMFNPKDKLGLDIESAFHARYDNHGFATLYFQFSYA